MDSMELITLKQASALSTLSEDALRKAIRRGRLAGNLIGTTYQIRRSALDDYMAKLYPDGVIRRQGGRPRKDTPIERSSPITSRAVDELLDDAHAHVEAMRCAADEYLRDIDLVPDSDSSQRDRLKYLQEAMINARADIDRLRGY